MVKKKDLEKICLKPQPLKFDDFVARCPEKLELRDGYMGQSKQNALQLLAMPPQSFGLVEAVKLVPKELWLAAIRQAYGDTQDVEN
ncbi:hypothetical protein LC608_35290 [Nostoc sp. XA010]|uniref:hypothetical protein n=1 Tax=Nostoc sp. XA010 TaxID=2780407 RepID=UPI001E480777|nr:hypothetical protein [Nostoc sp. XA010]MCC5662085.1 hypothetical protein [Nostoc sp. XA010]